MTHSVLPLKLRPELIHDVVVEIVFEMNLRWVGGTMSLRAAILSASDSSARARSSSSSEISDSVRGMIYQ